MLTYEQALNKLGKRKSKKIAHETWIEYAGYWYRDHDTGETLPTKNYADIGSILQTVYGNSPNLDGQSIAVRYHDTNIVVIHPDNTYSLFTGGWYTVTTKKRMGQYSPASVFSEKGEWFVWNWGEQSIIEFVEGMTVDSHGRDLDHQRPEV